MSRKHANFDNANLYNDHVLHNLLGGTWLHFKIVQTKFL